MELERFELVFLRSAPGRPDLSDDEAGRIQSEHLAFYADLRVRGLVATNGPVLDQPDETLRGLAFFRAGSLEEAKTLAESDPAVVHGRLVVDVMTWWCPPGSMVLPGTPITVGG